MPQQRIYITMCRLTIENNPNITMEPDFGRTKACTAILSWPPMKVRCTPYNCDFFSIAERTSARTSLEHTLFRKHGGAVTKFQGKCRLCLPELAPMSGHAARDHRCAGKTADSSISSEISDNESTPRRHEVIRESQIRLLRLSANTCRARNSGFYGPMGTCSRST